MSIIKILVRNWLINSYNMTPFEIGIDLIDANKLFGRNNKLASLKDKAICRENVAIIGPRRFGKTCVLKTMEEIILKEISSIFPVYFNAKAEGITKDSDKFYRVLAATVAAKMCERGIVNKGKIRIKESDVKFKISPERVLIEEQFSQFSSERQWNMLFLLSRIIGNSGKTLLLLLDDVDYVLVAGLRQASDFSRLRDKVSVRESAIRYWVSGPATFSSICSKVGSAELNNGIQNVFLKPIKKEDAIQLWDYECSLISDSDSRDYVSKMFEFAFEKSGGVPFYLKLIGKFFLDLENRGSFPTYLNIRDYLKEMLDNKLFLDSERNALEFLAANDLVVKDDDIIPDGVNLLLEKGLARQTGRRVFIPIGFLRDYILACQKETTPVGKRLEELVSEMMKIRSNVNVVWKRKGLWKQQGNPDRFYTPFVSHDEDPIQFEVLKQVCKNEADYKAFAASLYQLYYEGSNNGNNLPLGFAPRPRDWDKNTSEFPQMVMVNRHVFDHRNFKPNDSIQLTDVDLFEAINGGKRPRTPEDYSRMQYAIMMKCVEELRDMQDYLESLK